MIKYDFVLPDKTPIGVGKTLYLLGTSEDGPLFEPILIDSPKKAELVFGSRDRGTLVKAFEQAYDITDEISIFLMRITGKSATLVVEGFGDETMGVMMSFRSLYAGQKYNETLVKVEYRESTDEHLLIFESPTNRIAYRMLDYLTLGGLVGQINSDCRSGLHHIMTTTEYPDYPPQYFLQYYMENQKLSGGDDGVEISRDDLYIACDTAYNLLLGKAIDIIVPVGMYVDDLHPASVYGQSSYGSALYASNRDYLRLVDTMNGDKVVSYHEQLIDFCKAQQALGYMSHGVIGLRPLDVVPETIEHDSSYILRLLEATAFRDRYGMSEFKNGQWTEKGFYITVFGSEVVFKSDTPLEYYDNGAITYAALLAGHFDSTTNMKVPGNLKLRYELSEDVLNDLATLGVTMYRQSVRNGLVVNNGVTTAHWTSELHDVSNVRMVQLTLAYMNECVDSIYTSELDSTIRRRMLEDLVKQRLAELKTTGVLLGYDYSIVMDQTQTIGSINLKLFTKYTVSGIATSASISYLGG